MLYPVNNYRYYNINRHRQSKNNASNYIKNLLVRNDLNRYFRASVNHIMLYSKSTSKGESNYNQARIMAYAEPLLKLARALYDGEIYFNAYKDLKVNYYSLNPKDLNDSLQIARNVANNASLELEDIDIPEYKGKYLLIYQKAISSWWWGKGEETRNLYRELVFEHWDEMNDWYKKEVENKMMCLGISSESQSNKPYDKNRYNELRFKFKNSEKIENN